MREGWICPKCGRGVSPDEKHCEHGGVSLRTTPYTACDTTTAPIPMPFIGTPPWDPRESVSGWHIRSWPPGTHVHYTGKTQ